MSWYYIDASGTTLGPVEERVVVSKYQSKELNDNSYVWNGTTVDAWSLIKDVGFLLEKCKPKPAPRAAPRPAGGRGAAPRAAGGKPKKKAGGGARMNLLDSIRSGKQLKKVEKKPEPAAAASSGGSRMGGRPGGKMSLQDQLKMKLNKRSGPVKKSSGGSVGGGAKSTPSWKKKSTAGSSNISSGPKKTWGNKKSNNSSNNNSSSSNKSSGGAKMSKFELKKAIDNCNDDWILKAISKLLS